MVANGGAEIGRGITCRELVELITEYTELALEPAEREQFEAHLARCTGCRNHVGQFDATRRTLRHLGQADLTPRAREQLVGIFRDWLQHQGNPEG